jgi:hypothetical protein
MVQTQVASDLAEPTTGTVDQEEHAAPAWPHQE